MMKAQRPDTIAQQAAQMPNIADAAGCEGKILHNPWAGVDLPLGYCFRELNGFAHETIYIGKRRRRKLAMSDNRTRESAAK
jgi:hypothetical protein